MKNCLTYYLFCLLFIILSVAVEGKENDKRKARLEKKVMKRSVFVPDLFREWQQFGTFKIDSVQIDEREKELNFYLNPVFMQIPTRMEWIESLRSSLKTKLRRKLNPYNYKFWAKSKAIEDYIPDFFLDSLPRTAGKRIMPGYKGYPLVTRSDQPQYSSALANTHIALWPSHGLYYDQQLDRWQWQRARLWQTVEDIFPWSFTVDYLLPMLENAGACVMLPRERDTQIHEVIVDNDAIDSTGNIVFEGTVWKTSEKPGFKKTDTLFTGQNPFQEGSFLYLENPVKNSALNYIPEIPQAGAYAVYVSYGNQEQCMSHVRYEVRYAGDTARFMVNQCMGAGTWVYLGTFEFNKGMHPSAGSVVIIPDNNTGIITSDAVKFGGGMGMTARKRGVNMQSRQASAGNPAMEEEIPVLNDSIHITDKLSGMPRWMEGARYYLQFTGMPDSLVYSLSEGKSDYNDDYLSRGEWVNYLIGNSRPQYSNRYANGLNIPIDMAFAFHTDAGITDNDSVIGSLAIYSTVRNNGVFPDGSSKLASRDLADIIQTQIVQDIRCQVNNQWTRRGLWDREYSEAWRPVVPVLLLELLSHQNLADMRYGLDPRFKFLVARAVYKGMARYLTTAQGRPLVIQPLAPDHLAIEAISDNHVRISWQPVMDSLEKSAEPIGYKVYRKTGENGFDQGFYITDTFLIVNLPDPKQIYGFRVSALNEGGESFPGETLSVSLAGGNSNPVLIVNGFDRICGPAFFDKGDMAGIAWWEDEGVSRGNDFSFTGNQFNYDRNSGWLNDDNQGWGASHANSESIPVIGNTFSYTNVHGKALHDAGFSFVSVSDEAFETKDFPVENYAAVDLLFGEERGTPSLNSSALDFRILTPGMMSALERYCRKGGNVLLSGAYIGSDMTENHDSSAIRFAAETLHYSSRSNHATAIGEARITDRAGSLFPGELQFNMTASPETYMVESPDAIEPAGKGAFRIYRYTSGNTSAGMAYTGKHKIVALGFPFETINNPQQRLELMNGIMNFFNLNKK